MKQEENFTRKMHARERNAVQAMANIPDMTLQVKKKGVTIHKKKKSRGFPVVPLYPNPRRVEESPIVPELKPVYFVRDCTTDANALTLPTAVDIGATRIQRIKTGVPWSDAVMNGYAQGDCRFPDPFTLQKTSVAVISTTVTLTSAATSSTSSTSSYDYTQAGLFKGSPVYTLMACGPPSGNSYKLDWKSDDAMWYSTGINSADFVSRPNGMVLDIIPRLVGVVHTVKLYAFPVLPLMTSNLTTKDVAGWPSDPNLGLSPVEASWGGREWEIDSTTKGVRLVSVPIDSRCLDFYTSTGERANFYGDAHVGWSGWVYWFSGLNSSDRVDYQLSTVEEVMPITWGTATQYVYPASTRKTSATLRDQATNAVQALTDGGFGAFKWVDNVIDVAKKVWGIGSKIASIIGGIGAMGAFAPVPNAHVPVSRAPLVEAKVEVKDDDFDFPRRESVPMATPRQSVGSRPRNTTDDDTSSLKSSSSALARSK